MNERQKKLDDCAKKVATLVRSFFIDGVKAKIVTKGIKKVIVSYHTYLKVRDKTKLVRAIEEIKSELARLPIQEKGNTLTWIEKLEDKIIK